MQLKLQEHKNQNIYRQRKIVTHFSENKVYQITTNNQSLQLINFCSNDYLGFAQHPILKQSFQQAINEYGCGSGSAHLVTGHSKAHHALEEELADFVGYPKVLLFSTGYMANQGVISSLLTRHDVIFEDRLNHASLIDAGMLSRAKLHRYKHQDFSHLEHLLKKRSVETQSMIVTDSVFSMDGDIVDLTSLSILAEKYQSILMIDDAHGFGVVGESGKGCVNQAGLSSIDVPIYMATLGKAMGCFGAFVASSEIIIQTLIQQARSYIFTTAMPAAQAQTLRMALKLLKEENWRQQKLNTLIMLFKKSAKQLNLPLMPSNTAIQPILLGSNQRALVWSEKLQQQGLWVAAIRPPTVAKGTARLRITLSAEHTEKQVNYLLDCLADCLKQYPI